MKKKIKVGIIFGGRSAEHEVSLQSAKNILEAIDKDKYEPVLIAIDRTGNWRLNGKSISGLPHRKVLDVAFPIVHGPFGEDGTIQGLLKLANVPFVGAGVLGSAIGMDKDVAKRLLRDAGIPIAKFRAVKINEPISFEQTRRELGLPMFVKPANLGSSIGITKVKNKNAFTPAIKMAFQYDTKIIIEEYVAGRELAVAILGNERPIVSGVCEILTDREFYDYEAKYSDQHGATIAMPAKISKAVAEQARKISLQVFKVLCCEGMARVDLFLRKDNSVIVNEINTIPGFTSHSMYPKLWQASGLGYTELTDRLIKLAMARFKKEQKLKISYQLQRRDA